VIIRSYGSDLTESQRKVIAALMAARASKLGRAPTKEDLDVAKLLTGLGDGLPQNFVERGKRWVDAADHERVPGRLAVSEAEPELLVLPANEARRSIRIVGGWAKTKSGGAPDHEDRPV
jgi:hypothetical protein